MEESLIEKLKKKCEAFAFLNFYAAGIKHTRLPPLARLFFGCGGAEFLQKLGEKKKLSGSGGAPETETKRSH